MMRDGLMLIEIDSNTFDTMLESEAAAHADYNVGFVLTHVEGKVEHGSLGGSGTLVSIDGVEGILTAAHVVSALRERSKVGLILMSYPSGPIHRMIFDPNLCRDFSYRTQAEAADGPDLAFLVLPPDTTAAVKARKTFCNLSKRRDAMLERLPPRENGFWAVCGLADEWTADAPPQQGIERIKHFKGRLLGPLKASERRASGGFDYVVFEVQYGDGFGGPQSFGGYSGGGVWQLIVKPIDGVPTITDRHLMGVAYYQSDMMTRDGKTIRHVICHGRESIYRALIDRVREGLRG